MRQIAPDKLRVQQSCTPYHSCRLRPVICACNFGKARRLRLWEYGVGDRVRQSTFACLRRVAPGTYELTADVDVEVTFPGQPPRKITAEELAKSGGTVRLTAGK